MGTVEAKLPEDGIGGLVTLKFWASGSRSGEYSLSTVIYEPHRLNKPILRVNSFLYFEMSEQTS